MLQTTPRFPVFKLARALLPIAVAVSVGSALVAYQAVTEVSTSAGVAGEAKMQMLRDEHALVSDYVRMDTETKRLAYATADKEAATLRVAALEQSRLRLAEAERAKSAVELMAERKPVTAKTRGEPVTLTQSAPVAEPLPLAQLANVNATVPRRAEGPVRSRLRELASDVRRIPSLLQSAAGWVAEAVPTPRLPSLPMRHFSASI
jgi:hypothetical protein